MRGGRGYAKPSEVKYCPWLPCREAPFRESSSDQGSDSATLLHAVTTMSHPGHIQVTTRSHPGHIQVMQIIVNAACLKESFISMY